MMVKNLDQNVYESEVITAKSGQPSLLCFVKKFPLHSETDVSIEGLCRQFDSIQFYAAQEEEHEFFFGKFHFLGTPIFIFLVNGIEQARLLGSVTTDRLRAFIERNISKLKAQCDAARPGRGGAIEGRTGDTVD